MLLVLALRWLAFGWMVVVALLSGQIDRPVEAGAALLVVGCWTAWLTVAAVRRAVPALVVDLGVAMALLVVSGYVHPPFAMVTDHPTFAGIYPTAAVTAWGAVHRLRGGILAGVVLGLTLPIAYAANGVTRLSFLQALSAVGWGLSYVVLGGVVGVVADKVDLLNRQAVRSGERAARLAERHRLAARIHDDVLQDLGRLRARLGELPGGPRLAAVAEDIARQEVVLRELARSDPAGPALGAASLRDRLAVVARRHEDVPVRLVAAGPVPLPGEVVAEIGAAVAELLTNVAKHADARQVWLTVLREPGHVTVTVRDDGAGFAAADTAGLGLEVSVRARVERLGGRVRIRSRPGAGTEVELLVPADVGEG
ncbi:ATP-binding protein [Actinosynnema sp. NPDC020468]|uniref:sensor histidine kinase n=1 Tax=Actinosynnema sp. NPDC020468 TaxID=3154488 RepID=UPI00340568E0